MKPGTASSRPALDFFMVLCLMTVCASLAAEPGSKTDPGRPVGFISAEEVLDSAKFLPPPPAPGSARQELDSQLAAGYLELRDEPRWELALQDTDLSFPAAAQLFSCALGFSISEQATPRTYQLLQRTLVDLAQATRSAKDFWRRGRPFAVNGGPTCTPGDEDSLRETASYPSGHASVGWGWALILSGLVPDRSEPVLARGLAFGESRAVCNLHWHSDVTASQVVAAAVVAQLHGQPEFLEAMTAARGELAAARQQEPSPARDCVAEARALSTRS